MSFNLNRRNFLKTVVVSAGAVVVGATAGCNDDDDNNDANDANDAKSASEVLTGPHFFPQSVASGDPKPDSVVLWARVFDSEGSSDGLSVRLQVASDEGFTQQVVEVSLTAQAEQDNCLKVKITDLAPHTTYYYRFIYTKDDKRYGSSVGRTRTAPAPDADTPVRLAVLNCQDYIGKYYNTLRHLIEQDEDLDFILYVGDYIYETTGDPRFQTRGSSRAVKFTDEADAIVLGEGDEQFYAARSLSNYRDIYKTYRGDSVLQRLHERFPVIVMWDDHEYSNDCYRDVATYFNGRKSERDTSLCVNAEQAFFEFLPIDDVDVFQTEAFTTPPSKLYPNTVLYRDFQFGRHFHLVLSDYRSFRPDHIIPEDAFPGKVVLDKEALISLFEAQAPGSGAAFYEAQKQAFGPYVDMAVTPWNQYQPALVGILTQAYIGEGLSQEDAAVKANSDLSDKVSAFVFNQLVEQFNTAVSAGLIPDASELPPIDDDTYNNGLDRGIAYLHFGKQSFFTEVGVRYGVVKPSFDLYVSYLYNVMQQQGETPENVFGDTQQAWLNDKIQSNQATFLALVSPVSTASTIIDFSSEVDLPADFQTAFHLNIDDWDGFPHKRAELLDTLKNRGDALILSGDVHAALMTDHDGVVDFTAPAVSSGTYRALAALSVPIFAQTFNEAQTQRAEEIMVTNLDDTLKASFDKLKFAKTHKNGYLTLTVDADKVTGTFYMVDPEVIASSYYDNPTALAEQFTSKTFIYQQNLLTEASIT